MGCVFSWSAVGPRGGVSNNLESGRNFAHHPLSPSDSMMLALFLTCCKQKCFPLMHSSRLQQSTASLKSLPCDRMVENNARIPPETTEVLQATEWWWLSLTCSGAGGIGSLLFRTITTLSPGAHDGP